MARFSPERPNPFLPFEQMAKDEWVFQAAQIELGIRSRIGMVNSSSSICSRHMKVLANVMEGPEDGER